MGIGVKWIDGPMVVLALANTAAFGQRTLPPPVKIDYQEVWDHIRGERHAIHTDLQLLHRERQGIFERVGLEVIVSENGIVDSAKAVSGPREVYAQAEEIERHRSFIPFRRDGVLVRASISDTVAVEPFERWADTHVLFPQRIDLATVLFTLQRTACYGTCPDYTVTIHGDGTVEYVGESFVRTTGACTSHIAASAVADLLTAFRVADFFSARDEYRAAVTDNPSYRLTLKIGGQAKTITDYVGAEVGMPDAIHYLEWLTDETAGTAKWVHGYKR